MVDDNNFPGRRGPLSRRAFLQLSAGAGLLAALGPTALCAASDTLNVREIPASGERIPVIGLGTARTFNVDPDNAAAMRPLEQVLQNFYGGGGRLVDSSPMYGQAETVVGQLAERLDIADDLFMATKVWTRGREAGIEELEASRKRMGGAATSTWSKFITWSIYRPSSIPSRPGGPKAGSATSASPIIRCRVTNA